MESIKRKPCILVIFHKREEAGVSGGRGKVNEDRGISSGLEVQDVFKQRMSRSPREGRTVKSKDEYL